MKTWWLREYGELWREWALVMPGGHVVVYDETGRAVRRTSYGSRWKANAILKLKRFRRLKRKELKEACPPALAPLNPP